MIFQSLKVSEHGLSSVWRWNKRTAPLEIAILNFTRKKGFKNYFTLYWFYCQYLYNWIGNKFLQLTSPSPYKYINNINQICIHNHLWWIAWLYVRVGILLPCGKHLFDRIISLRGEVWAHNTSLTPPLLFKVPVPSQDSGRLCMCIMGIDFTSSYNFDIWFWNCSDSNCGIFCFPLKYLYKIVTEKCDKTITVDSLF